MKHDDNGSAGHDSGHGDASAAACAHVRELLAAAAERDLEAAERAQLEAHLSACGPCRAVASWMPRVEATAARAVPPTAPSDRWLAQLKSRVMDEVRSGASEAANAVGVSPVRRGTRADRPAGLRGLWPAWPEFLRTPRALATLAVAALVGIFTYAEIRDRAVVSPQPAGHGTLASGQRKAEFSSPPATTSEPTAPVIAEAPAEAPPASTTDVARAERQVDASPEARPGGLADDRVALLQKVESTSNAGASRARSDAPAVQGLGGTEADAQSPDDANRQRMMPATEPQPVAQRRQAVAVKPQAEAGAVASLGAERQDEPTASFDLRTAEVLADADSLTASTWDEARVRGAIALVMQARPPRDVEAAVGELLLALEDAPRPTRAFARLARRQAAAPAVAAPAPNATAPARESAGSSVQGFEARGGVAAKELVPGQTGAPAPGRLEWSSLEASAAATSVADSAAAALLLRLPELPEGAVRERAAQWLAQQGLR